MKLVLKDGFEYHKIITTPENLMMQHLTEEKDGFKLISAIQAPCENCRKIIIYYEKEKKVL